MFDKEEKLMFKSIRKIQMIMLGSVLGIALLIGGCENEANSEWEEYSSTIAENSNENESEGDQESLLEEMEDSSEDSFISDWTEGEKNSVGNSSWNLSSFGYVTEQGDWTYFFVNDSLCKEDVNGNKYTIASSVSGRNLNIIGDWLYFYQSGLLYRIRTDGNEMSSIPVYSDMFYVTEDGIVYLSENQVSAEYFQISLNICELDFTNNREVYKFDEYSDNYRMDFSFLGIYADNIYLSAYYEKKANYKIPSDYSTVGICAVNIKNNTFEIVSDNKKFVFAKGFIVNNKLLAVGKYYHMDNPYEDLMLENEMWSLNLDSMESEILLDFPVDINAIGYLDINDGQFVLGLEHGMFRATLENWQSELATEISGDAAYGIALTEKYIYYRLANVGDYTLYRVDYNGDNWELLGSYEY